MPRSRNPYGRKSSTSVRKAYSWYENLIRKAGTEKPIYARFKKRSK